MPNAIFLDRDGTLIHAVAYASQPEQVYLYEEAFPSLRNLQKAGFLLIIVTNQSGIARGYFSETDLRNVHAHLTLLLSQQGIHLDALYVCPHHPEGSIPAFTCQCACRKPKPGMLFQAAHDFSIDLTASWCVGDMETDVEAGRRAGCRTCLIRPHMPEHLTDKGEAVDDQGTSFIVPSLSHALHTIQMYSCTA